MSAISVSKMLSGLPTDRKLGARHTPKRLEVIRAFPVEELKPRNPMIVRLEKLQFFEATLEWLGSIPTDQRTPDMLVWAMFGANRIRELSSTK